jgi:tetratricopeptide (TPR) repeat protein
MPLSTDMDIESFWEYSDPALSEERFRLALNETDGDERLELLTQLARTYSLRRRFGDAHAALDEIEPLLGTAGPRPNIRYLLERGRTFNSGGDKDPARTVFLEAWERAQAANETGLAVDAAHMLAITYSGIEAAITWNQRGLALARPSTDTKARALIPAMLNNTAWDLHEMGRFEEALPLFQEAQAEWTARRKPDQIRIAHWSVARCLRSLKRYEQALTIQRELDRAHTSLGAVDGYVFEELAELLEALGKNAEARAYFAKAADELGKDNWFVQNESARLARLRERAG